VSANGTKPTFVARANVSPNKGQKDAKAIWITIGAAWQFDLARGEQGFSIRLNALPLAWDGQFSLLPMREDTAE
jgi:hypothetical protein